MSDFFNNLPPGFNAPYGLYTTGGAGNPANHGFAPKSSPSTGNPMIDVIAPMAMQALGMKVPEFSRPQTSDHAYTMMQERMRVSKLMHPSIVASNPQLKGLGKMGQNSLIQQGMDSITDGGSRVDAFNTIFGNFSSSLAGPGIKNMDENAIGSANILKNFDVAFTDEKGEFNFDKSSGFNRAETFKNVAAYDKQFGGFSGKYENRTDAEKNKEYLNIAKSVMDRPAIPNGIKGIDSAQKEIDQGRQKLRQAEQKMTKAEAPDLSPSIDVLKTMLGRQKDPSVREKIESVIDNATDIKNGRDENPIIKDVTEKIKESSQTNNNKETNNNTNTQIETNRESTQRDTNRESTQRDTNRESTQRDTNRESTQRDTNRESTQRDTNRESTQRDTNRESTQRDTNRESTQGSASSVLKEITNKFKEFDKQNQTPDLSTVIAKIDATVSKFGNTEDKVNLEKAKQTQIENSASESEQVKNESLDLIEKFGNINDIKKVLEVKQGEGSGFGVLAEQQTEQNKEQQAAQIQKIQEVNKMTREGQNVFGQDMPLDEVMSNIKGLTEGMGDVETPDVTGLLQKIQATATVVDMSNDALVKYFDVVKNMYKGMGIKGPSSTEMAQNALLSAKASVDARKEKAQREGKMYTGPSAEEEAQKIAELQGGVVRSGATSNVMGFLDTLSDEGAEGAVKKRIQEKVNQGDLAGAEEEAQNAAQSQEISTSTAARAFAAGQYAFENGPSQEQQARINSGLSQEGRDALNGADVNATFKGVKAYIGDELIQQGQTGDVAREMLGEGSDQKIKEFVNNDLTEGDIKDRKSLTKKLQEKYSIDSTKAEKLATTIQSDFEQQGLNDKKIALTNPEREAKQKELKEQRVAVQKEIESIGTERSGQLKNMNIGAEAFAGIKTVFKKLQGSAKSGTNVTAEDVAREQGKDWDKMSEKEKKAFKASVDLADSDVNNRDNETTKKYKKIEEESSKKAKKEIEQYSKKYNLTEEEKKQKIEQRTEELKNDAVKEAGIDGKSLEKGEEENNKNFDPKEAVDRISRLLEGIASKLGVSTMSKSDTSANAKTENNGGWLKNIWD